MSVQVGLGVGPVNQSLHQSQRRKTLGQQTVASYATLGKYRPDNPRDWHE